MVIVVIVVVIIPRRGKLPTLPHSTVYKKQPTVDGRRRSTVITFSNVMNPLCIVGNGCPVKEHVSCQLQSLVIFIIGTIANGGGLDVTQAPESWCI